MDGIGAVGTAHSERGLTYYEVELSGHMVPQFVPWVSKLSFFPLLSFISPFTGMIFFAWYGFPHAHPFTIGLIPGDAIPDGIPRYALSYAISLV